ncbi:hypothetical protein D3C83_206830 [compost metagenome]
MENRRETNSKRVGESSKIALYISISIAFCRRRSKMKAIRGFTPAMYVKFCSGPTPRYTPPGWVTFVNTGMTS